MVDKKVQKIESENGEQEEKKVKIKRKGNKSANLQKKQKFIYREHING